MQSTSPTTIAVIPARSGSKGVPGKNLRPLAGKPLLSYAITAARAAEGVSDVYVSSDSAHYLDVGASFGAKGILRPDDLSGDLSSSESALLHVLDELEAQSRLPDQLLFLQCTSPLLEAKHIETLLREHQAQQADSSFLCAPFAHFLWRRGEDGAAVGVNHDASHRPMRQEIMERDMLETGAAYLLNVAGFREAGFRFFGRNIPVPVTDLPPFEIDTEEDFYLLDHLARQRQQREVIADLPSPLSGVAFDFDGVFTDNRVYTNIDGDEQVVCDRGDGMGISLLRDRGIPMIVISKERVPIAKARCAKLNIPCATSVDDKPAELKRWAAEEGIELSGVVFVGNDINDIPAMQTVGYGVAVADAHPDLLPHADLKLKKPGGYGAIRELADLILSRPAS